ncbi:MAG: hypothetical protein L6R40_001875 [Gallowayella cf. fulva]|nr:MAG: hypothetical protein L6R40_001875 [Xanthomendoza cf. fulva]
MASADKLCLHHQSTWKTQCSESQPDGSSKVNPSNGHLSSFETIITTHQPVWESLLLQLPTSAILDLYHASKYLQSFLRACPTAWSSLSFRRLPATRPAERHPSPASDSSREVSTAGSKPYALDQLLISVVLPFGTCMRCLDLDQTAVSGHTLTSSVLPARRGTLQHLSVRGCKNVSLKYHILPYLNLFQLQQSVNVSDAIPRSNRLALRSLYTFRCRHHRRRPYLGSSLTRRDSDSEPTHELIKICRSLDIWTDTGWCPTPGGRCFRRKDYFTGRGMNDSHNEVWVVFDRLWRSGNRIGPSKTQDPWPVTRRGQLWQDDDYGYGGEALGTEDDSSTGHGKLTPTHLRQSHKRFVEGYKCHACGDQVIERCEQCSIRMHCIGCRKTLCASCAYSRPLPLSRASQVRVASADDDERSNESLWWAPNARRSPNLMDQEYTGEGSSPAGQTDVLLTPTLETSWCCLKPQFSIGGGISLLGPGISNDDGCHIRTAPLPQGNEFEDAEFRLLRQPSEIVGSPLKTLAKALREGHDPMLYWILFSTGGGQLSMCPRNLCNDCSQLGGWKAMCRSCRQVVCFAHDVRGLKTRVCGYRDLSVEDRIMKERMLRATQEALNRKHTQIKIMDRITEYLQRNGTLNEQCEYDLAVVTELPSTDDEDDNIQEEGDEVNEESTRLPRIGSDASTTNAFAFLPFKPKAFNQSIGPLNTSTPWRGCASFICPEYRSVGDPRRKCSAVVKKCTECKVNVCPECWEKRLPCDCSYCKDNYHCPNCFPKFGSVNCKKAEELELQRQEEEAKRQKKAKMLEEREGANEIAGQVGEFFAEEGGVSLHVES